MKQQQQNLRVDTTTSNDIPLSTDSFTPGTIWPRVDANHRRAWEPNPQPRQQDATNDVVGVSGSRRTIQRSFAFDEWDEEAMPHDGNNESPTTIRNGDPNPLYTMDELEEELHRTILRTFAFDEWEEEDETQADDETGQCASPPFVPIPNMAGNHDNPPPQNNNNNNTTPSTFRFGLGMTKFDLDATAQPVTPKVQRPVPLYSHQSLLNNIPPARFDVNAAKEPAAHNLESMLRDSFVPSFPLHCESIPRQASAFSIPKRNDSQPAAKEEDNRNAFCGQEQQQQQTHWFDMYGSGTTLFEDDDYIFESPTSSSTSEDEDDSMMFSLSGIPRFVVCYKNNE